jgi:hypothetical protein
MLESFSKYFEALTSPLPTAAALFIVGIYFITAGFGITAIKLPWFSLSPSSGRKGTLLYCGIGAAAMTGSVLLAFSFPVYKPWISRRLIYGGHDAKQVVADGADVYLLKESGNIDRI